MSATNPYAPPAADAAVPRGDTAVRVAGASVAINALLSAIAVFWVYARLRREPGPLPPMWAMIGPRIVFVALDVTAAALLLVGGRRFRFFAIGLATVALAMPLVALLVGRGNAVSFLMPAAYLVSLATLLGGRPSHGRLVIGIVLAGCFIAVRIARFF